MNLSRGLYNRSFGGSSFNSGKAALPPSLSPRDVAMIGSYRDRKLAQARWVDGLVRRLGALWAAKPPAKIS
jgi:hypothetical protein